MASKREGQEEGLSPNIWTVWGTAGSTHSVRVGNQCGPKTEENGYGLWLAVRFQVSSPLCYAWD